ncbi:FAD-binding oxidoreductase [Mesorhizobium sp. B2-4-9]|uniref:NAD(P)/FAD-dependent oxidoreductase n=1 Tax=Mesorhizobium sp. B2-4-9 TaxID=2589940 RepID=UPI001125B939|nr:FAD-dependent oxidoreductase [Mesorhizobium sp. B2-4-9]TPL23522.1 FAD-binding oxidoreductase [Mesorhizobium sp. B2-4-9]
MGTFQTDVAIVGGGIVGCSTALSLARKGRSVTIFERGKIASEQSSRAWGFIRRQGRHEAELPLAVEALELWADLTSRYGTQATQFTRSGILVPAETAADEDRIRSGHDIARSFGLSTRLLDAADVRQTIPELAGQWRGGLFTADDAHADPALSTRTIAAAAREAGVTILEDTPVFRLDLDRQDRPRLLASNGIFEAKTVVLANGIGAPVLAASAGLHLPIQIVKSSVGRTWKAAPFTRIAMWGPRVAFRPSMGGDFIIGNGYRGMGVEYEITVDSFRCMRHFIPAYRNNWRQLHLSIGADFRHQLAARFSRRNAVQALPEPKPNMRKVIANLAGFRQIFPHLNTIELQNAWAGRLDITPDVIPIIDRPKPELELFVAAGFSGHGFALGPSIGKQLGEWVTQGSPSINLSAFALSRFEKGIVHKAQQAL